MSLITEMPVKPSPQTGMKLGIPQNSPLAMSLWESRSLKMVTPRRIGRQIAALLILIVLVTALCLIFVPWQQTVVGYGQVIVFSAMDRPQNIEAQIPGRVVEWNIQEGQTVKKGDVIARIEDTDSKFLAVNQNTILSAQRAALMETKQRTVQRAKNITEQQSALTRSRRDALQTAQQRVQQAKKRLSNAVQTRISAEKAYTVADTVARQSAREQAQQAKDAVIQAQQAVTFASQNLETARLQRNRVRDLFAEGLRSRRDNELAQNDLVKNETELERAQKALEIARRGVNLRALEQNRADIERDRARTQVEQSRANLEIAERDVFVAQFDLKKLDNDTTANISSVGASLESARESLAKAESDIQKQEAERQNLLRRTEQQVLRAPRTGKIVRLFKIGAGETVKAGDVMAVLVPDTPDRAVEIMVSDNDVPLITEGRKVRVQFAGWPALQWAGWPSAAVGTFAGVVSVIDAVDDGTARYRLVVHPDWESIKAGSDALWPKSAQLRPGAEVTGWVMLETVPLGFELWRQFNAFPPTVKRSPMGQKGGKADSTVKKDDRDGEKNEPFIKVKNKK